MNGIKTPLVILMPLVTHMLSCFLVCVTLCSVVGVYCLEQKYFSILVVVSEPKS